MTNPGRTMALLGVVLALLLSPITVFAQQQRVEVLLSTNRVSTDESVILNVRAYGLDKEIDYSALNENFVVTARSSSRQVTIENGARTSLVEWVIELLPKSAGTLEIPPIIVGTEQSRPTTLLVDEPPTGSNRDLYLESSVDSNAPYVQGQIIYVLKVFQDVRFLDASLQVPEVDGVVIQQLADERSYQETVEGRAYTVREIRYAIFPQSSGPVVIPPMALQAVVPVDPNQQANSRVRTKRLTRRSNPIELDVQARPTDNAGSWWLPAVSVSLQSEWSEPIDNLTVDQPITRTVRMLAQGVNDAQLPEMTVPMVDNLSIYADSPEAATNVTPEGLVSQQINTWAVIPQAAGEITLPEVQINWFDTKAGVARVATVPAETLIVKPSVATSGSNAAANGVAQQVPQSVDTDALGEDPQSISTENNALVSNDSGGVEALSNVGNAIETAGLVQSVGRWKAAAYTLLAGWGLSLLGLWFWWRKRVAGFAQKPDASTPSESARARFKRRAGSKASLEPVRAACDTNDASKISKAVLSWGAMVWPEKAPTSTAEVAKRLQSSDLKEALDAVDAQQFRPSGSVNSVAFDGIPDLLKQAVEGYQSEAAETASQNALPSL